MELVRLNQTDFSEVRRYSNYSMMAWNLTWPKGGDFQYRTYDVSTAMVAFQKGHLVGNSEDFSVMQITEMTLTTDNKGVKYVELKGETPLNIFDYRPAQKEILTITSYDVEYPDGWEFGDPESTSKQVDPLQVAKDVIQSVDRFHYGHEELSYLKLPFIYVDNTEREVAPTTDLYPGEKYSYYTASGSVGDVLDELCHKGNFGMIAFRPNYVDLQFEPWAGELRYLGVHYYRPVKGKHDNPTTFYDLDRDMLGSNATYRLIDNVYLMPTEDYVTETRHFQLNYSGPVTPPSGLTARVNFTTRNVEDLKGAAYYEVNDDLVDEALETEKGLLDVTLETNGIFTNAPKKFLYDSPAPDYFLGDRVSVRVSGMGSSRNMRVKSFIRTQDNSGYKEYPEFEYDSSDSKIPYFTNLYHHNWN